METDTMTAPEVKEKTYPLFGGAFYKENPEKILGDPYEASSRFGKTIRYKAKEGETPLDAVAKIVTPEFISEGVIDISAGKSLINPDPESQPNIVEEAEILKTIQKTQPDIINKKAAKKRDAEVWDEPIMEEIQSFEEVLKEYNPNLTIDEIKVFLWYMHSTGNTYKGKWLNIFDPYSLRDSDEQLMINSWAKQGLIFYYQGEWIPKVIYFSGDLYDKKNIFDKEKSDIIQAFGSDIASVHESKLQEAFNMVYTNRLKLDDPNPEKRLKIKPFSEFAKNIMIGNWQIDNETGEAKEFIVPISGAQKTMGEINWYSAKTRISGWDSNSQKRNELSLAEAFRYWLKYGNPPHMPHNFNWEDIFSYYLDKKAKKDMDPTYLARQRALAKDTGEKFFSMFMAEVITEHDRVKIEYEWNKTFNNSTGLDYDKIPIAFSCAKNYPGNDKLEIRPEKREGVAFHGVTGSSLNAYGVGYGKTWVAIFIMAQSLDAGHCKRPFLVVPNQVYKQFYSEIKGILPHRKINDLYNLSKDYISQFIDENGEVFQVDEGSISMLTYQGLERLGFNETTQANMFDQLTDAISMLQDIDISTKKGAKDIVREKGKLEGIIGKALAKSTVKIEDFGFDFVCFDEAHALKKIFTQVKARKSEEGESKNKKMYEINAGIPSTRGIKGYFVCSYIQMLNKGNNVLLLTATPFTNSPLEVYSMLSLVAYTRMREMNLANINDFFDNFCQMSYELVINSKLQPERKQIFKGFYNLIGLQKLIYKYMLYKEAGKLDKKGNTIQLVRPDKWVLPYKGRFVGNDYISAKTDEYVDTVLPLTESQKSMMEEVIAYVEGNISYEQLSSKQSSSDVDNIDIDELITSILDENPELTRSQAEKQAEKYLNELQDEKLNISENSLDDEEKAGVRTLRGVNFARNISLSPYLYEFSGLGKPTYKTYIESSPKLTYIMKCIKSVKKWHENNKDAVSGQVIYMDRGKNHFELIKEYLIQELGYKEHEIGIIRSGKEGTSTHKDLIKNGFNGMVWNEALKSFEEMPDEKRIKIIIGTSSIREGMNLQKYSTVLYNAFVDWNPTDQLQLEGRVWRQGNTFKNVRIVLPLMSDSMDIFMFQKLEEKTSRINSIWNYDGQTNVLPIDELDPQEQKMALVTNPRVIAEMESERDVTKIEENISFHETNIQTANNVIDFMRTREKFDKDLTQIIERIASDKIGSSIEVKVKTFESALESGKVGDKSVKSLLYGINTYSNDFINYNGELKKPWNYGKMKGSVAMLKKAKEKFLDKYGIDESIGAVEFFIEGEQGKIKEIQEEIQRINSSEYLDNRASEIEQERKEKKIRFATVDERVAEFESLNHLLGIKREAEPVKSKKILETAKSECPPMTKDGMRDISKAGIRKLEACIKDIPDTKFMHIDADGNYTPERLKVHDRIIGKLRERAECVITNGKPPIAVLMGGVPGCFTANQLIVTADGVKPISEITPFDDVLSYNHETKKNEYRIVEKVHEFPTHQDRIIRIKMKDGTVIEVTENHEFYDGKEYVKIKDILKPIDVNNIL
jgi:hypothetical protein